VWQVQRRVGFVDCTQATAGERQLCKTTNRGRNPEKRKKSNTAKSKIA